MANTNQKATHSNSLFPLKVGVLAGNVKQETFDKKKPWVTG
jgi:hypothetical protein